MGAIVFLLSGGKLFRYAVGTVAVERKGTISGSEDIKAAFGILCNGLYAGLEINGQPVVPERARGIIVAVKSLAGAYPQIVVGVTEQRDHRVVEQRGGVVVMVKEGGEAVTVKSVQPIVCGHPDIPVTVLTDLIDESAGKQVGGIELSALRDGGHQKT